MNSFNRFDIPSISRITMWCVKQGFSFLMVWVLFAFSCFNFNIFVAFKDHWNLWVAKVTIWVCWFVSWIMSVFLSYKSCAKLLTFILSMLHFCWLLIRHFDLFWVTNVDIHTRFSLLGVEQAINSTKKDIDVADLFSWFVTKTRKIEFFEDYCFLNPVLATKLWSFSWFLWYYLIICFTTSSLVVGCIILGANGIDRFSWMVVR